MFEDVRMRPIVIGKVEMVDIMEVFCILLLAIYGYIVSFVYDEEELLVKKKSNL